jgi:hypothetical protein
MTSTPHLEPFDFSNLVVDKPTPAPRRHAATARAIAAGTEPMPAAPDVSVLPGLWNDAVLAIRAYDAAAADLDTSRAELVRAESAMAEALASRHDGLDTKAALAVIRGARDNADMAGLAVRRAESVFDQVKGHRRNALLELASAVEAAGKVAATRAAVDLAANIEAQLDPELRARIGSELDDAVNMVLQASGKTAAIGGRTDLLHDRIRDIRVTADPTASAIAYFMRSVRELIELVTPAEPAEQPPVDPILRGIVDEAKPRRRRAA